MMRFRAPLRSPFRWDPWHEIEDLRHELHRIGERSAARAPIAAAVLDFVPEMDLYDAGAMFVVRLDVPGVREEDLEITAEGSTLTIGGRRDASVSRDECSLCCERPAGRFARTMELPEGVDPDRVKATLKLGVLEITVPKSKATAAKRVAVTLGEEA